MYRNFRRDVIAVTCVNSSVPFVVDHMKMGAKWVFSDDDDPSILDAAMTSLVENAVELDASYREHLALQEKLLAISPNEWKVLDCVLEGMTNKEIAKLLDVSVRTTESRRAKAYRKLGIRNLTSMVRRVDRQLFLKISLSPS